MSSNGRTIKALSIILLLAACTEEKVELSPQERIDYNECLLGLTDVRRGYNARETQQLCFIYASTQTMKRELNRD